VTAIARAIVVVLAVIATATVASAQSSKADVLFKRGKKLLDEKKYAQACAAFEASQRAEPTIGTQLNIARCYEEWGKLATAYDAFAEALRQAEADGDDRLPRIQERIDAIEPTVPTLVIRPDSRPVDLEVRLDGKQLASGELGVPHRLDPGDHLVEYRVGDGDRKRIKVTLAASDHETVTLEKLAALQVGGPVEEALEPDDEPVEEKPDPTRGRTRRIIGVSLAAVGVVGIGISTWVVLDARADYRAALAAHCNADRMCDDIGLDETRAARRRANIGTVLFSTGLAAVAGGVILYLTAPEPTHRERSGLHLTPVVTPDATGVVLSGAF
jgi:tetratricopeptide (TPR) repeat protein